MQVVKPYLQFTSKLTIRRKTERIVIHHAASAGDIDAQTVHKWHLAHGWKGIGYNYLIRTSGIIEVGRPENTVGTHAGYIGNTTGIGICLAGNFMTHEPNPAQITALVELIRAIQSRYGRLLIQGHKELMQTACPGAMFPMARVKQLVATAGVPYPAVTVKVRDRAFQGFLFNGATMCPIKDVLVLLGVPYQWEAASNSVRIGFNHFPALVVNGTGYLPIRELASAIDKSVLWDAKTRTATIVI